MAGSGDSTVPFPDHRRRQLSESDDARRYSGEPLAIGVDRVGIAHHGHHFRSRTAAMISTPHRRSRAALVIAGCASLTACVVRSEEHTSELQSLMRISYAVFCLQKKHSNS